jgi:hypothetical protein
VSQRSEIIEIKPHTTAQNTIAAAFPAGESSSTPIASLKATNSGGRSAIMAIDPEDTRVCMRTPAQHASPRFNLAPLTSLEMCSAIGGELIAAIDLLVRAKAGVAVTHDT